MNLTRVLHGCSSARGLGLDGVAIVSEIMAVQDPCAAAERLAAIYRAWRTVPRIPTSFSNAELSLSPTSLIEHAGQLLEGARAVKPLVHQVNSLPAPSQSSNSARLADNERGCQDTVGKRHTRTGRFAHHGRFGTGAS